MSHFTIAIIRPLSLLRGDDKQIFEVLTAKHFVFLALHKRNLCATTVRVLYTRLSEEDRQKAEPHYTGTCLCMVLTHSTHDPVHYFQEILGSPNVFECGKHTLRGMLGPARLGLKKGNPFDDICHASVDETRAQFELECLFPQSVGNFIKRLKVEESKDDRTH